MSKPIIIKCIHESAPAITDQSRVQIYKWKTYECSGEIFLVCEMPETGRIRVSTPVAFWDKSTDNLITESGRIYKLMTKEPTDRLEFTLALLESGLIPDA